MGKPGSSITIQGHAWLNYTQSWSDFSKGDTIVVDIENFNEIVKPKSETVELVRYWDRALVSLVILGSRALDGPHPCWPTHLLPTGCR